MKFASLALAGLAAMAGIMAEPPRPEFIIDGRRTRSRRPAGSKLARMAAKRRLGMSTIR